LEKRGSLMALWGFHPEELDSSSPLWGSSISSLRSVKNVGFTNFVTYSYYVKLAKHYASLPEQVRTMGNLDADTLVSLHPYDPLLVDLRNITSWGKLDCYLKDFNNKKLASLDNYVKKLDKLNVRSLVTGWLKESSLKESINMNTYHILG